MGEMECRCRHGARRRIGGGEREGGNLSAGEENEGLESEKNNHPLEKAERSVCLYLSVSSHPRLQRPLSSIDAQC